MSERLTGLKEMIREKLDDIRARKEAGETFKRARRRGEAYKLRVRLARENLNESK